jgi:transcriptional regulator with XRE-family HTH domain
MAYSKLPNYLKRYRKRAGLSQDDVAFLLGVHSGAKVCRYERFVREPTLRTALAFAVIFGTPARELFGGLFQKVEKKILARARTLAGKVARSKSNRLTARKLEAIQAILAERSDEPPSSS